MDNDIRRRNAAAITAVLCIIGTVLVVIPSQNIAYALAGLACFGLAGGLMLFVRFTRGVVVGKDEIHTPIAEMKFDTAKSSPDVANAAG